MSTLSKYSFPRSDGRGSGLGVGACRWWSVLGLRSLPLPFVQASDDQRNDGVVAAGEALIKPELVHVVRDLRREDERGAEGLRFGHAGQRMQSEGHSQGTPLVLRIHCE